MELMLRIVLFTLGVSILVLVIWDILRRKSHHKSWGGKNTKQTHGFLPRISKDSCPDFSGTSQTYQPVEPTISDTSVEANDKRQAQETANQAPTTRQQETPEISDNDLLIIHIVPRQGGRFQGGQLLDCLHSARLDFCPDKQIFVRRNEHDKHRDKLFSVVQMQEPGYFDLHNMGTQNFKGITLFYLLNNTSDPSSSLEEMIKAAKLISFKLNGELLDGKRQPLTLQGIDLYRHRVHQFTSVA